MKIEMKNICDIKPYEKNQKIHDEKQISNVANSIKRFGWQQPIVVDDNNVIIIGHCRFLAAKELGLEQVPVTIASGLTENEVRELRILDNKTNESQWDFSLLSNDINELSFDGFDFDFEKIDPYLPEPYDEELVNEYAKNSENYVVKKRIIITFTEEEEKSLAEFINQSKISKVVYDFSEIKKDE